jgi:hypothetical protein
MFKKQNGFGTISVLIVIIVIVVAAGIGWFVYKRQPQTHQPDAFTTPTTSQQRTSQPQTNPYAGWKTFKSVKASAQFKYPKSWSIETHDDAKIQNFENTLLITPKDSEGYSFTIDLLIGDPTSQNGMPLKVYGSKQVGNSYIIFFSSKFESTPSSFTISKYDVIPGEANPDFVEKQYTKDATIPVIFMGQLSKRDDLTTNSSNHDIDTYISHQYWNDVVKVMESFSL